MEDEREALEQAHTTLLDAAIQHGAYGYHLHCGMKDGQVRSIVFATTDPEVIGKVWPALVEVQQMP